ncbi:hypothetical protein SAMN05216259_115114 [Actinacidiphila guanduensis]|uniref:Uncharacterized protein n=1 Tax=Actinacidiphila guanduensis TaxID=310781 RepID=A0A1H0P8X1_9ACTN|nr:hypothetical protein SAMN05216259_115114 [Actinacidiphila guanduensis]
MADVMHKGAYPVGGELVRRLVAGRFPRWKGLDVRPVASGGTVNALFRLGEERWCGCR